MLGAIAGDVIGSVFERAPCTSLDFPLFTPRSRFTDDTVLTVATAEALEQAAASAAVSHDHPEGIRGAQAVALAVYLARNGAGRDVIRQVGRAAHRLRPVAHAGRDQADVRLRGLLPGVSAGGDYRLPRGGRAGAGDPQRGLARRERRHAGGDRRRHRRGLLGSLPAALVREVRLRLPPEFVEVIDAFDAVYPLRGRGDGGAS